jgi:predicted metal-dependent enzyme (double-stranded beta helix superfamily)
MTAYARRLSKRSAGGEQAELQPQDWHEVASPPPGIAHAAEALAAHYGSGPLTCGELRDLVANLAGRDDLWRPLVVCDAGRRRYRLLFEDPRLDVWVLSWMPAQATGYHDHGVSNVALTTLRGAVLERQLSACKPSIERRLVPGIVRSGAAGYIHSVTYEAGEPAVTLHAYSPPLLEVGQYRAGPDAELLRERQHGRRELLDHTIADSTRG